MYSLFNVRDDFVFVEVFTINVPGAAGPVSVQRRLEVAENWQGRMDEMPVAPDRDHFGTPFVPAEVAVMLVQMGVLKIPDGASYTVQYAGSGKYFSTNRDALAYCARRWPDEMRMFNDELHKGAPLQISPSRQKAFAENTDKLRPWIEKAATQA